MSTESTESDLKTAEGVGFKDGFNQGLKTVLDWLEVKYISDPGRPDRNSVEGRAILEVAREANEYIQDVKSGKIKVEGAPSGS